MKIDLFYVGADEKKEAVYIDGQERIFINSETRIGRPPKFTMIPKEGDPTEVYSDAYTMRFIPRYITSEDISKPHCFHAVCPCCNRDTSFHADSNEMKKIIKYRNGGHMVQDMFSEFSVQERELLITQYCYFCQNLIFSFEDFELGAQIEDLKNKKIADIRCSYAEKWISNIDYHQEITEEVKEEIEEYLKFIFEKMNFGSRDILLLADFFGVLPNEYGKYVLYGCGTNCDFVINLCDHGKDQMTISCYVE